MRRLKLSQEAKLRGQQHSNNRKAETDTTCKIAEYWQEYRKNIELCAYDNVTPFNNLNILCIILLLVIFFDKCPKKFQISTPFSFSKISTF